MSPTPAQLVFISYKHVEHSTRVARRLRNALEVVSDALEFNVFLDDEDLRAGDGWQAEVNAALAGMTHFIALLTDEYWLSPECRRELNEAINRYEDGKKTRLLFVLVDDMRPDLLSLNRDRRAGRLVSDDPKVQRLGDIHFLGPYNSAKQLVRLKWEDEATLRDQIKSMIDHFERTLPSGRR
jgi:hypothetical protein